MHGGMYANSGKQIMLVDTQHTAYTQNKAILAQPLVSSIKRWELNLQRLLVIITMGKR